MPYLTFGGYSATHGVTRAMRFGNGFRLRRSSTASFILLLLRLAPSPLHLPTLELADTTGTRRSLCRLLSVPCCSHSLEAQCVRAVGDLLRFCQRHIQVAALLPSRAEANGGLPQASTNHGRA